MRKVKAELAAEREAARLEYEAAQRAEYPAFLMRVLELVTKEPDVELTVMAGLFTVLDRESRNRVTFAYSYDPDSKDELETLESELKWKREAREAAYRKYMLRQAVLDRLTDEEREALDL